MIPSKLDSQVESYLRILIGDEDERSRITHDATQFGYRVRVAHWPSAFGSENVFAPRTPWIASAGPWGSVSEIVAELKRSAHATVILAIVAESHELIAAMAAGANDAVIRPLRSSELFARLRASVAPQPCALGLTLDAQLHAVQLGGMVARLRRAEFNVLQYIVAHGSRVVSAQELLEAVFGTSGDGGSIRNHVWEIRRKLRDAGLPMIISTVKGLGYRVDHAAIEATAYGLTPRRSDGDLTNAVSRND